MTTFAVHDTSIRGCPSSFAGTVYIGDTSPISPYALPSTIRCRTDRSGSFVGIAHTVHRYDPPATVPSYNRPAMESGTRAPKPSQPAAILSPEPYSGLPIGDKGHSLYLPCQPPTAPQSVVCCRTDGIAEPLGDLAAHVLLDLFDPLDGLTRQHLRRMEGWGTAPVQRLKAGHPVVYSKTQCGKERE